VFDSCRYSSALASEDGAYPNDTYQSIKKLTKRNVTTQAKFGEVKNLSQPDVGRERA
jgi:hypothetical protein